MKVWTTANMSRHLKALFLFFTNPPIDFCNWYLEFHHVVTGWGERKKESNVLKNSCPISPD